MFKDFCHQIGMKVAFASVCHPQTNRAVEGANGLILEAIKKILKGEKNGKWAEVMPQALWRNNTRVCRATNFMSFWLMYGAEAILPKEVKHQSLRTAMATPACPSEAEEKDLLESDRLAKISGRDKCMERPKGQITGFQCGQFGTFAKPSH
jgi:hypothetical protein